MIFKQICLTPKWDLNRYNHFWVRVDLRVMAMMVYSTHSKSPKLEPHHQMQFKIIPKSLLFGGEGGLLHCGEYSQHILSLADGAKYFGVGYDFSIDSMLYFLLHKVFFLAFYDFTISFW